MFRRRNVFLEEEDGAGAGAGTPAKAEGQSEGEGGTPAKPERILTADGWMTAEEIASKNAELQRQVAELGRTKAAPEPKVTPISSKAEKALREAGYSEDEISELLASQDPSQGQDVAGVVQNVISQYATRAQQDLDKRAQAEAKMLEQDSNFDQSQLNKFLAQNPFEKETFDTLMREGKHLHAFNTAWNAKQMKGGKSQMSTHARNAASGGAPPSARAALGNQVGATSEVGRKAVSKEILESVAGNPGRAERRAYALQRSKGTPMDLDASPPADIGLREG